MNNTTRVILLSLLSVAVLAGCKTKATKDNTPPVDNSGTTGTVIGAVAGGLLGHEVAGRNSRTEGAIIGAAVGALAGRAIDKSDSNCRR